MKFITLLLFTLLSFSGYSCMCTMYNIESDIRKTNLILIGKVIELLDTDVEREEYYFSKPDHSYRVKIEVQLVYKGRANLKDTIEIQSDFSNCDEYYKIEESYLLFMEENDGVFNRKQCSYSGVIPNVQDRIEVVEKELKIKKKNKYNQIKNVR